MAGLVALYPDGILSKLDPRWASWNLGVFLCIRCSGIHRGMGTHISKVKSVDLDVWTPEQMQVCCTLKSGLLLYF
jgi:hypothetical protein